MMTAFDVSEKLSSVLVIAAIVILSIIILAYLINRSKYKHRYKRFFKKLDKTITKKYNGNVLNEGIVNDYAKDNTNTYKSLRRKGRRKVRKYLDYYAKKLPEQVLLKSFTSPDKRKNALVIYILDENDKVLYRWYKKRKRKGFIKAANKHQMLTPLIGYLFELPLYIDKGAPYRLVNPDNDCQLTYEIVKNPKKRKRKKKPKKLSKKELKAQRKIENIKESRR